MPDRWVFVDADDNEFTITNGTFRRLDDASSIEVDDIERSSQAGSVFPGEPREESKEISFEYDVFSNDELVYQQNENIYSMQLRKARVLKDMYAGLQTDIILTGHDRSYEDSTYKHFSHNTVTFKQLNPYWEEIELQESTLESLDEGDGSGQIVIANNGYVISAPVITIDALQATTKFTIYVNETRKGIIVNDLQFGTAGLDQYIIDCKNGTCELDGIDRKNKIKLNTGFFNLRIGINTLIVSSNGAIDVLVQWRRRTYL